MKGLPPAMFELMEVPGIGAKTAFKLVKELKIGSIGELEKAAKHFNYIEFGYREFSKIADISGGLVKKRYGGWKKGLETKLPPKK